jgi:hypothetical protein
MKNILFLLSISICNSVFGQFETSKQLYKSPELESIIARTKTVAILPFKVSISYKKLPKGATVESIKENEKQESIQMQDGMYTYLLRKADDYSVSFQDVGRTNALLKKAGIFDSYDELLADSICKLLKVDAIIKSNWNYAKTGSEAGAIATAVLLGVSKPTGSGQLVMQVYDSKSGELAWRLSKEMNEGAFSSANLLMERMMRKVGRLFPFEIEK